MAIEGVTQVHNEVGNVARDRAPPCRIDETIAIGNNHDQVIPQGELAAISQTMHCNCPENGELEAKEARAEGNLPDEAPNDAKCHDLRTVICRPVLEFSFDKLEVAEYMNVIPKPFQKSTHCTSRAIAKHSAEAS